MEDQAEQDKIARRDARRRKRALERRAKRKAEREAKEQQDAKEVDVMAQNKESVANKVLQRRQKTSFKTIMDLIN